MNTAAIWACALVLAIAAGAAGHLDGPEDHQGEWAEADAIAEMQARQAEADRLQAIAQGSCDKAYGPQSEARMTPDGDLKCTTWRGLVAIKQ